ncbi:MAG TPA: hypothetical protein VLM79_26725, partial [Kofleriaceae bacterium]|nr:hypothetical protein [Kofleriaceae bacterium]
GRARTAPRIGQPIAEATAQPRLRLHATSQRDFAVRIVPASITFEVDAQGKVTGFVLHHNGRDQRAASVAEQAHPGSIVHRQADRGASSRVRLLPPPGRPRPRLF